MKRFYFLFISISLSVLLIESSCKKPAEQPPVTPTPTTPTVPTTPTTPEVPVVSPYSPDNNKWECEIDGIKYRGSIDTSFYEIIHTDRYRPDTLVTCSGTSTNKNANIHFLLLVNRSTMPGSISTVLNGLLVFDTLTTRAFYTGNPYPSVDYTIDSMDKDKLSASFSGIIRRSSNGGLDGGGDFTVTNGKFNCEFKKGNAEPKYFSFLGDNGPISGYFSSGEIISDCLIMNGRPNSYDGQQTFKLMVRTGGTVQPGIYKNTDGNAALSLYSPSYYPYDVTGEFGDLTVTITSVQGNIVVGTFSGISATRKIIQEGKFICRIKNYQPETDAATKWRFAETESAYRYNMYGGNITKASTYKISNAYYLVIEGGSDHGESKFKIQLSSNQPITTGKYNKDFFTKQYVDSINFFSNQKQWNGTNLQFYANEGSICTIDSIDSKNVYGTLSGTLGLRFSSAFVTSAYLSDGKFKAAF